MRPAPEAPRPDRPAMPDQPPPSNRPPLVPEARGTQGPEGQPAGPAPGARRQPLPALAKVALVAAAAVASLAANWLRWINPFVDSGREMNVPARLAAGERLYRDIVFYYGPAGPWLQALVLRASGGAARVAGRPRSLSPVAAPAAAIPFFKNERRFTGRVIISSGLFIAVRLFSRNRVIRRTSAKC